MSQLDALKQIEEKHKPSPIGEGYSYQDDHICQECDMGHPCDVVKLARALDEARDVLRKWQGLVGGMYEEDMLETLGGNLWKQLGHDTDRAAGVAERTLEEVAG